MVNLFIVANWKSNKTIEDTNNFLNEFKDLYIARDDVQVVICPPYLSVSTLSNFIATNNLKIDSGVQDISPFDDGAFTGEVSASQIKELVKFTIIGHSERRKYFGETDELLSKKCEKAQSAGIEIIFCVQNEDTPIPQGVKIVAYEPVEAIGTGHPDTPENADRVAAVIRAKHEGGIVLYGGSVTAENVNQFTSCVNIGGVLVGGASLNPSGFSSIIKNA
ncbi:MAG TPA: triose-phosphate isomerase [Patescibacteria group bacterium]|nr:triose-phosphate isomerase [Patescibacteria group bacterium]